MKVLLLTRPWNIESMRVKEVKPKSSLLNFGETKLVGVFPPTGLLYLSAVLKKEGHNTKVIDGHFSSLGEIKKEIKDYCPKLIGISSYTCGWEKDKKFIKNLKQSFPKIQIVAGGPHASAWKEKCLKECKELDFVTVGDGEYVLCELAKAIENKKKLGGIKGIIWRSNGKIVSNQPRELIKNLDELPFPDWEAINLERYVPAFINHKRLPTAAVFASRGCPFQCIFCHSKELRMHSVKRIVDEIEYLVKKFGVKDITFYDETFTVIPKRTNEICDEILKRKINIVWGANSRVDRLDLETLKKMKKTGCWRLLFGIESGVQKNLNTLKKGTTLEQIKKAIRLTRNAGIESLGLFIFGIPGETFEEGLETIKFACDIGLDYAGFNYMTPLPGTEMWEIANKKHKFKMADMDMNKITFVPETMTKKQLETLMHSSYRKFYMRPWYLTEKIFRIRSLKDASRLANLYLQGFISFFMQK